jgi:hypothetical protein
MFDLDDPSANADLSDDKYNAYIYKQYLSYAMLTLEKSDDSYDRLLNDSQKLDYKVLDLLNHIGTQDLTIAFLKSEIDTLKERLNIKCVRVRRLSDDDDDGLILYRAGSGGQS